MTTRRGLGKGKGSGWKNIISNDPHRHNLSRMGVKSATLPKRLRKRNIAANRLPKVMKLPLNTNNLPLQFGIIVPKTKGKNVLTQKQFMERVNKEKQWFSINFGGDTSVKDVGSYWDGKKLVKEPGSIVWSSMSIKTYYKNMNKLVERIKQDKKNWQQQSVLFKIEGRDFIYPKQDFIDDDKEVDDIVVT